MITLRLSKTTIIVSFWVTVASFLLYVTPVGGMAFGHIKIDDILLAVFGAGISSLGVGILEYHQQKKELEDKLLNMVGPLISAVEGLREIDVGSIEGTNKPADLLLDYFREAESNELRKKGAFSIFPAKHDSRNALVCAIERCGENDVESFIQDESSSSMVYIHQHIDRLNRALESYLNCDKVLHQQGPLIDSEITRASYLFGWMNKAPCLAKCKDARKTNCLGVFSSSETMIRDVLEPAFQQARLFNCGQTGYSKVLDCLLSVQKRWLSYAPSESGNRNQLATNLFEPISQLAKLTKSDLADNYENLWPTN